MNRKLVALLLALVMLVSMAACGNTNVAEPTVAPQEDPAPATEAQKEEVADPFGKYDETITLTAVRYLQDGIEFVEGESIENNVWSREYLNTLGIELSYDWVTPQSEYSQKLNVTAASDQLPDIMWVDAAQLKRMVEDDQLADLTEVYSAYAAEYTDKVLHEDGGSAMESATIGGKLYDFFSYTTAVVSNIGGIVLLDDSNFETVFFHCLIVFSGNCIVTQWSEPC